MDLKYFKYIGSPYVHCNDYFKTFLSLNIGRELNKRLFFKGFGLRSGSDLHLLGLFSINFLIESDSRCVLPE